MAKAVHDGKDGAVLELSVDDLLDLRLGLTVNTVGVKTSCQPPCSALLYLAPRQGYSFYLPACYFI